MVYLTLSSFHPFTLFAPSLSPFLFHFSTLSALLGLNLKSEDLQNGPACPGRTCALAFKMPRDTCASRISCVDIALSLRGRALHKTALRVNWTIPGALSQGMRATPFSFVFIITSYSSRETREATQVLQAHQHVVCVVEVAP